MTRRELAAPKSVTSVEKEIKVSEPGGSKTHHFAKKCHQSAAPTEIDLGSTVEAKCSTIVPNDSQWPIIFAFGARRFRLTI